MPKHLWYNFSVDDVLKMLKSERSGLSETESRARLEKYGPNLLPEKKPFSLWRIWLRQFSSPMIYLLLGAALISFFISDLTDVYVILAAVIINVVLGFFQEYKAERALYNLKKIITLRAKVVRSGMDRVVDAKDLVPGDIILLNTGDKIPADGRLIESFDLLLDESSLTGESLPINKFTRLIKDKKVLGDQQNMVFMGTSVVGGSAKAVVVETGRLTHLGQIAGLLRELEKGKTPLQQKLANLSRSLVIVFLVATSALFFFGVVLGRPIREMFLLVVAIGVAAIPEGLLVGVTAVMAIGMQRMLRRKALIRRLIAAETLGSTSVICTDKTGTLTEGHMGVARIVTASNDHDLEKSWADGLGLPEVKMALKIAALCNESVVENIHAPVDEWTVMGSPTNKALLLGAVKFGLDKTDLDKRYPRVDLLPFNSEKKYLATLHHHDQNTLLFVAGAFERVLNLSNHYWTKDGPKEMTDAKRQEFLKKSEHLAAKALRLVAVAFKESKGLKREIGDTADLTEAKLTFGGIIALRDPIRAGVKETIRLARAAGIRTVMITGDHKATAMAIGADLGFEIGPDNVLEGKDLSDLSEEQLEKRVKKISIYARVSPQDKLKIVRAWRNRGEVVAVTGDGTNDAPALKAADIGVALGSGTDVTKETADMVLLDNNFQNIVAAIEEGRGINDNIRKIVLYLLSDSFTEIILIALALVLIGFSGGSFPLPLLAAQILWINLVTDALPNVALTLEPTEKEIMSEPPIGRFEPILNWERRFLLGLISSITGVGNFLIFMMVWRVTDDLDKARTVTFASLGINTLLYVFSCRSLRQPIWRGLFKNQYLILAVFVSALVQLSALYWAPLQQVLHTQPLNKNDWLLILSFALVVISAIEASKLYFISYAKRQIQKFGA